VAQNSWFFNSAPGDPRYYQASDFARYFGKVLSTGLLHIDNVPGLQVKANGTDLRTYVEPGGAIMEGYEYENTDNEYLTHTLPEVGLDRIDRIVLRLDKKNANRYIRLFVIEGEPSTEPVAPVLQRDNLVWELSLAQVRIRANTSTINPSDVFDERLDRTVCGLVFSLISKPSMADIETGGYAVTATVEGQKDFEIPLQSFDKVGDGLTVFVDGKKAEYNSYEVLYPRTVRFNVGLPINTKVEFEIIRGRIILEDGYVVNAGKVGVVDAGNYYESENVEGALQKIGQTLFAPQPKVYGVRIDLNNQDPKKAVERIDDASGFTSYTDFNNVFPFNQIKPCVLKEGVVQYYLNPNNFDQKEDGSPSNITDFLTGDVMIEFPRIYWNLERDSNYQYVRFSEGKVNENYQALAHQDGDILRNKLYISAYGSSADNLNKLRSVSGKLVDKNKALSYYRTNAKNNGVGYGVMNYYQLLMIQILYLVQFADRNALNHFSPATFVDTAGALNTSGMIVTKPTSGPIKYLGLEQILTNLLLKLDGFFKDQISQVLLSSDYSKYNDTGVGYELTNLPLYLGSFSYTRDIIGNNKGGFLPRNGEGSSSTWYAANFDVTATNAAIHFGNGGLGGFFNFRTGTTGALTSPTGSYARLIYLK
jgi:hypothetical protein